MVHLLLGLKLFIAAVCTHWQIWLSGSGVGGFVVIASSLVERLTGKSLSRKTHVFIFVGGFFFCSCLLAWIEEHDHLMSETDQFVAAVASFSQYKTDCEKRVNGLSQDVAVREAISQTLQQQNRAQQNSINGCLSQAMKLLQPEQFSWSINR